MTDGRQFLAATGSSSHSFISTSYRPLLSKYTPSVVSGAWSILQHSIIGLSSDSSMSVSNPDSENSSSTDDSSNLAYSSDDESSLLDYSSDGTSSHLDLPQRLPLVALQRKYLTMTETHTRRTVTARGRRRRAIRRMSKPTVKMKYAATILPTGP
jgi:hypothetical protein